MKNTFFHIKNRMNYKNNHISFVASCELFLFISVYCVKERDKEWKRSDRRCHIFFVWLLPTEKKNTHRIWMSFVSIGQQGSFTIIGRRQDNGVDHLLTIHTQEFDQMSDCIELRSSILSSINIGKCRNA